MPKKEKTPVTVQVARWTALAAGITTLGSIIDAVWTYQPWWFAKTPAPKMTLMLAQMPDSNQTLWNNIPAPVWILIVSIGVLSWAWKVETRHRKRLKLLMEAKPND